MVGRSNVGKSSLINHLTGKKSLARVSAEPGRTQTINFYEIDKRFFLVDLPGYGYAKTSKKHRAGFAEMIHAYLEGTTALRLVLLIIDANIPPTELDNAMLRWLQSKQIPFFLVMNRMDKLNNTEKAKLNSVLEKKYPNVPRIAHSIQSEKTRTELWTAIEKAVRPT